MVNKRCASEIIYFLLLTKLMGWIKCKNRVYTCILKHNFSFTLPYVFFFVCAPGREGKVAPIVQSLAFIQCLGVCVIK